MDTTAPTVPAPPRDSSVRRPAWWRSARQRGAGSGSELALALALALSAALLLLGGCGERGGDVPLAGPLAPTSLGDLESDHSPERLRLAIGSGESSPWLVRLEAMRLIRRERPDACAQLLAQRALSSRNEFEQASALDALAYTYPLEASRLLPGVMTAFHGEPQDALRLALVILRYHLSACYGISVEALVGAGPLAVFTARQLLLGCGEAITPELAGVHPSALNTRLMLQILGHAIRGEPAAQADGEALSQADFPDAALSVYAETYHRQALPVLQQCLQSDGVGGHAVAADALADLGEEAAATDIFHRLQALPVSDVGARASFLLALGTLHYAPALELVISASHDDQAVPDADGVPTWPLAQAALLGLATYPDPGARDALVAALTRSERPAVVVSAAQALLTRQDVSVATAMARAAEALGARGATIESNAVLEDAQRLLGEHQAARTILAYVVRYQGPDGSYSVITDQPLIAVDAPGRAVKGEDERCQVSQEALLLSRSDISSAIQLRNSHLLEHLHLGSEQLDDVDMIAR